MYFPKNKIETNLFTSGELVFASTGEPYFGSYFKTYNGEYYTGKEPNDGPNNKLIVPTDTSNNLAGSPSQPLTDLRFEPKNITYTVLTNQPPLTNTSFPIPYTPQPTEKDYKTGEITRFFAKKRNENIYYEVENNSVSSNPIFATFSMQWVISGEESSVRLTNQKMVELYMEQLEIPAFNLFLKNDYLKFWKSK